MVAFMQVLKKLNKKKKIYFLKTIFKTFVCSYKLLFYYFCLTNAKNLIIKWTLRWKTVSLFRRSRRQIINVVYTTTERISRTIVDGWWKKATNVFAFSVFISSSSRAYAKRHTNGSLNLSRLKSKSIACASRAVGYDVTCKRFEIYCVFMTRQFCFFHPHTFTGVIPLNAVRLRRWFTADGREYRKRSGFSIEHP